MIKNKPKYFAGMKVERYKNQEYGYHDPICYGLIHLVGRCLVRCDLRKLCKSKSLTNNKKIRSDYKK